MLDLSPQDRAFLKAYEQLATLDRSHQARQNARAKVHKLTPNRGGAAVT